MVASIQHQRTFQSAVASLVQILVEQSLVNYVGLEWTGIQGTGPIPAAPPSSLALRNYALLVHRLEADTTASQLTCSTTSLSGKHAVSCSRKTAMGTV